MPTHGAQPGRGHAADIGPFPRAAGGQWANGTSIVITSPSVEAPAQVGSLRLVRVGNSF